MGTSNPSPGHRSIAGLVRHTVPATPVAPADMEAVVRFTAPGFHRWPGAEGERAYLAGRHRHLFHVEVRLAVYHEEREVEYHDLLDFCRLHFPGGELGGSSCETMARGLLNAITRRYPGRRVEVHVFEDGEVGAVVRLG